MSEKVKKSKDSSFRAVDLFVVLLCLLGIAASFFMFQRDMFSSFRSLSSAPAGVVMVKYNTVQRRFRDRVIWDRLSEESPVYNGDIVRIARLSGATLNIDDNYIELGENTLIRIQKDSGPAQIEFFSGDVNITSSKDSGVILLSIGEQVVQASPGTVFSASSGEGAVVLQITEGTAQIIQDGQVTQAPAGTVLIRDAQGNEVTEPTAAVTRPRPNARYLKTESRPQDVEFAWIRMNMRGTDLLRLEIAEDRNFSRIARTIENLNSSAYAALDAGFWYWRLSLENKVLASGRVTVTEAPAPVSLSPNEGRLFLYGQSRPEVQLRWSEVTDASSYLLQISSSPDFINPRIDERVQGTFFVAPNLDAGTWYWRVQPVFSPIYEGGTRFSQTSSFRIEQGGELASLSLNMPQAGSVLAVGDAREDLYFSWSGVRDAVSYTIRISNESDLSGPVINRTVRNNFFVYGRNEPAILPGQYYWGVYYTDANGYISPLSQPRPFLAMENEFIHRLIYPPDRYVVEEDQLSNLTFTWETNMPLDKHFQVSSRPDFSRMELDVPVSDYYYYGVSVPPGEWYWRITARPDAYSPAAPTSARRFTMARALSSGTAAAADEIFTEPSSDQRPQQGQGPLRLSLISPEPEAVIPGLTAAREPTVFRWDTAEEVASSRFVISRQTDPLRGRPEVEIINPGRTVTVNRLSEGVWYWTVEARTRDGRLITTAVPRQLTIQSSSLLPAPANMLPPMGHSLGVEQLRQQRNIVFSWSRVEGANAYILSIYRDVSQRRRQIFQSDPMNRLNYNFDNFGLLDNGTFIWQVEAVSYDSRGIIERRGRPGESSFTVDIPRPGRVRTRDTGVLYGTE